MLLIKSLILLCLVVGISAMSEKGLSNRIVLIRHAEKGWPGGTPRPSMPPSPPRGSGRPFPPPGRGPPGRGPPGKGPRGDGKGKFPSGLSAKGKERAQYIRTLFGNESEYDFGLIFAAPWDASERDQERTYATVAPLAQDLGLGINIDCANSELSCITDAVREFSKTSDADILICWKHFYLNQIAQELGADNANTIYPDDRNDVIWIMEDGAIVEKWSMHCPVLDDGRVDEEDPDLEVESSGKGDGVVGSWWFAVRQYWRRILTWLWVMS